MHTEGVMHHFSHGRKTTSGLSGAWLYLANSRNILKHSVSLQKFQEMCVYLILCSQLRTQRGRNITIGGEGLIEMTSAMDYLVFFLFNAQKSSMISGKSVTSTLYGDGIHLVRNTCSGIDFEGRDLV